MTDKDKIPFALIMGSMGAAFRVDVSRETMAVFFNHLLMFTIEAAQHAGSQVIEHEDRFPTVKRMKDYCNSYRPSIAHLIPKIDNLLPEFTGDQFMPRTAEEADKFFRDILKEATP